MKTQLLTTLSLLAAMTFSSATASAQDEPLQLHVETYDFNPTLQVVGATVGAGAGAVGGIFLGAAIGAALPCESDVFGCIGPVVLGSYGGLAIGGLSGAVLGASLTGGDHAQWHNYAGAAGGALLGGLVAVPLAMGVMSFTSTFSKHGSDVPFLAGALAATASVGLGASLGYRLSYQVPVLQDVTFAPMVGERNGLVLSGRF